jgi:hypothetical protein
MRVRQNLNSDERSAGAQRRSGFQCLTLLLATAAISGALAPRLAAAEVELVVVDVVAVADGYRASKLPGDDSRKSEEREAR